MIILRNFFFLRRVSKPPTAKVNLCSHLSVTSSGALNSYSNGETNGGLNKPQKKRATHEGSEIDCSPYLRNFKMISYDD
jgi:hypothetical protein